MLEAAYEMLPLLLKGAKVTLIVAILSSAVTLVCAVAAGLCRLSKKRWVRAVTMGYVEVFRGTSLLIQLIWVYFALPLIGIDLDKLAAAVLAIGLNYGAYGSEIVRSTLLAIPAGQREAAIALNFTPAQAMVRILFPQAFLRMLPPLGNLMIELVKGTSLVYFITLTDLLYSALVLRTSYHSQTGYILLFVLVIYFAINYVVSLLVRMLERKLSAGRF